MTGLNLNTLVITPEKTHIIIIGSEKGDTHQSTISIMASGHQIVLSDLEKLLGGQIHNTLTWNQLLVEGKNSLVKQLVARNNSLKRVSRNAMCPVRLMISVRFGG